MNLIYFLNLILIFSHFCVIFSKKISRFLKGFLIVFPLGIGLNSPLQIFLLINFLECILEFIKFLVIHIPIPRSDEDGIIKIGWDRYFWIIHHNNILGVLCYHWKVFYEAFRMVQTILSIVSSTNNLMLINNVNNSICILL